MTTPSIEEMVEEFEQQMPLMRAHGKLLCATASPSTYKKIKDWLRTALTEAHQAGRDEAVERLQKLPYGTNGDGQQWVMKKDLDDTTKALKDNK